MNERSFSDKFLSILSDSFDSINEIKRSYLILDETNSEITKEKYENILLKQLMQLELSIRKMQKINSALSYFEQDKVNEKKEDYCSNSNSPRLIKSI